MGGSIGGERREWRGCGARERERGSGAAAQVRAAHRTAQHIWRRRTRAHNAPPVDCDGHGGCDEDADARKAVYQRAYEEEGRVRPRPAYFEEQEVVELVEDVSRVASLPHGRTQRGLRIHAGLHSGLLRRAAAARLCRARRCAHGACEAREGDVRRADHPPRNRVARRAPLDVREDARAQRGCLFHGVTPGVDEHKRGAEKHEACGNDREEQHEPCAHALVLGVSPWTVPNGGDSHERNHLRRDLDELRDDVEKRIVLRLAPLPSKEFVVLNDVAYE